MADNRGRTGRPWERMKREVWATETHCWLCGRWVDQSLPWRNPWSRSVDHVMPLAEGGNPLARTNLRLAHRRCNVVRGNLARKRKRRASHLGALSRQW